MENNYGLYILKRLIKLINNNNDGIKNFIKDILKFKFFFDC